MRGPRRCDLYTAAYSFTRMLLMVQKEPCALLGVVWPQNGEDCEDCLLSFLKTSVQEGGSMVNVHDPVPPQRGLPGAGLPNALSSVQLGQRAFAL